MDARLHIDAGTSPHQEGREAETAETAESARDESNTARMDTIIKFK